jgi:diaminohydroxyphosphoribosylaminopyrimidine deaminase/5-amino-6-(5-phosphoribosylamino)uracil reductase
VVIGVGDPNPSVRGGGCERLREAGIEVVVGVAARACLELIWPFVVTEGFRRPYVELKTATSLDGRFASPPVVSTSKDPTVARADAPGYLTGEAARRDVHRRRRWVDLVLVGEGTARADRPRLDARLVTNDCDCPDAEPACGYVDSDLSYRGPFGTGRYYVFHGEQAAAGIESRGLPAAAEPVFCSSSGSHVDPRGLVHRAGELGLVTIMLESGPRLAAAFLSADLIDRWVQYTAPLVLGAGPGWPTAFPADRAGGPGRLSLTRCERYGADLCAVFDRSDFATALHELTVAKAAAAAVELARDAAAQAPVPAPSESGA